MRRGSWLSRTSACQRTDWREACRPDLSHTSMHWGHPRTTSSTRSPSPSSFIHWIFIPIRGIVLNSTPSTQDQKLLVEKKLVLIMESISSELSVDMAGWFAVEYLKSSSSSGAFAGLGPRNDVRAACSAS